MKEITLYFLLLLVSEAEPPYLTYKGYDAYDRDTLNVVMYTPSMEVIQQHMENKAEVIASAGGESDPERMSMSIASD